MTKDVLLSISGLHYEVADAAGDEENEPIEVIIIRTISITLSTTKSWRGWRGRFGIRCVLPTGNWRL